MILGAEEIQAVVFYRKERAWSTLKEAEDALKGAHWNLAVQRMYYAVYYMASALLMKNKIFVHTHNGVVGQIGMRFVKTGKLTKDEGRLHTRLLQARVTGDYNDFFDFTEEEAMEFLQPTRDFLKRLEELIDEG